MPGHTPQPALTPIAGPWTLPGVTDAKPLPRDPLPDATLAFLTQGYEFVGRRCDWLGTDAFETRLLLRPAVCVRGEAAARMFYDQSRFRRCDAAPERLLGTLFGHGGVQTLDGEAHAHRKAMLMSTMTPASVARLTDDFERCFRHVAAGPWSRGRVVLLDAVRPVLLSAALAWVGIPRSAIDADGRLLGHVTAMIDGAAAVGGRFLRARHGREACDRRFTALVLRVRRGDVPTPRHTILHKICHARDGHGNPLPARIAAVELNNLVRPTVAVAWYLAWLALAIHREAVDIPRVADDPHYARSLCQEVRRFYPFFPVTNAMTRHGFEWNGYAFPANVRVVLDLYGTNRDPRLWESPNSFRANRFLDREPTPFDLIPQGGGDYLGGHRCAGEWATLAIMARCARLLASTRYDVPPQDLTHSQRRFPARPRSGFVMTNVRSGTRNEARP